MGDEVWVIVVTGKHREVTECKVFGSVKEATWVFLEDIDGWGIYPPEAEGPDSDGADADGLLKRDAAASLVREMAPGDELEFEHAGNGSYYVTRRVIR